MRINKYLASAISCSRREADRLVLEGHVKIDGKTAIPGDDVGDSSVVYVKDTKVSFSASDQKRVVLAYNKPVGLICSNSTKDGDIIFNHIDYPKRLLYAGRLDKNSRGLMLLTTDGKFANNLMRGRNAHAREYIVTVDKELTDEAISKLRKGIFLPELNVKTKKATVKRISEKSFSIILKQGLNRQIRRMCKECNLNVIDLLRVRIENIELGGLKEGAYRKLTAAELNGLDDILHEKKGKINAYTDKK